MKKRKHSETEVQQDFSLTIEEMGDYNRALRIVNIYRYLQVNTNIVSFSQADKRKAKSQELTDFEIIQLATTFLKNRLGTTCRTTNLHAYLIDCEKGMSDILTRFKRIKDSVIKDFLTQS